MSRYVARISCVLCLLTFFSALLWSSPSQAVFFTIQGTDYQVSPAGTDASNPLNWLCPLRTMQMNDAKKFGAYMKSLGSTGVPVAVSADGKQKTYFNSEDCRKFFGELAARLGGVSGPSPKMACQFKEPGVRRENCVNTNSGITQSVDNYGGVMSVVTNTPPSNPTQLSTDEAKKISDKKAAEKEAEEQCFEGTLDRIGQYWAKQRGVQCVKVATRFITKNIKKQIANELKHMESKQSNNLLSNGQGGMSLIVAAPSLVGIAQSLVTVAKYALAVVKVAQQNAADLDFLLNDCLQLSDKFTALQTWKKGVLGGLCKQVASLVERQLTQCIRVNVGFDLSLPQFSVMMQCPININVTARLNAQGAHFDFNCIKNNPIQASASWGGQSLLGASGGLEGLFNGNCFKSSTDVPTGTTTATRVPGVDCSPNLSTDPARSERLQGLVALTAGAPVANGWVAGPNSGGSETLIASNGSTVKVTRCDYYVNGARQRTSYVYGDGSSCNTSTSGFLDNGVETNTACYAGGYTPVTNGDTIPDACLYPTDCINPNSPYTFVPGRQGTGNCPASAQPALDTTRRYPIIASTGGVSGGNTEWRSCEDFSGDVGQAPVCCDPQKQDCRQARSKNIPICLCDQGDSSNTYIDSQTGQPFPDNKCDPKKGGGMKTCCTASLNGGTTGCTNDVGMAASDVCANGDQCTGTTDVVGTDSSGNPITAGSANTAKPSPWEYLEIRPDVILSDITNADGSAKQCCTTPWCNICPQHYANAFGMAADRANWTLTRPARTATAQQVKSYNNAILGKGWPFTTSTNAQGETTYTIGINPSILDVTRAIRVPGALGFGAKWQEDDDSVTVSNPMLHLSDKMENKPSSAMMDSCNNIGSWKIGYTSGDNFGQGSTNALGYVYDSYIETPNANKTSWKVYSGLPEPREMPLDYLIRTQSSQVDGSGVPTEPIQLCSEIIKICQPGTQVSGGVGGSSGGRSSSGSSGASGSSNRVSATSTTTTTTSSSGGTGAGMIAMQPAATTTTLSSGTAGASGTSGASGTVSTLPSGSGPSITVVPSASGGSGTGSLY